MGSFSERLAELRRMTHMRDGKLTASVVVDQVYAHYQHEGLHFRHPRGGQAKFLEDGLNRHYRDYIERYARAVLHDGGVGALMDDAEHLSDQVEVLAPVEFSDLRRSGHPSVHAGGYLGDGTGGEVLRDREPKQHRLTEEELRIKSRIRYLDLPDRLKGWIWWHVQHHTEPPPRRGR